MRGYITRGRVDGSWYLRVELARRPDGRRHQRREAFWGTKREAESRLRDLLRLAENGGLDAGRITVGDLCERWVASSEHRVGTKTFQRYSSIVRLHLIPSLGSVRTSTLRPSDIETALNTWMSGDRKDGEKGNLSSRSVKHILDTLKSAFRWALKMNIISRNPVDAVSPPRVERHEMRALDVAGVGRLLDAASGTDLEAPVIVAVGTGLRRGELLGLRWSDIDVGASRLTVRRSIETVNGVTHEKAPKTVQSSRMISLPPFVSDALRRRKVQQTERRLILGLGKNEDCYVFTRADESPWEPGAFSLHFARLVQRHRLPHVRFHDLRHTFGTLALASGVDLKSVSTALGHSTISMTANTYVHAVEALRQDAAARLDLLLGSTVLQAVGKRKVTDSKLTVPQRCHVTPHLKKKAHIYGPNLVAPTGIEPVNRGPGRSRRLPRSSVL